VQKHNHGGLPGLQLQLGQLCLSAAQVWQAHVTELAVKFARGEGLRTVSASCRTFLQLCSVLVHQLVQVLEQITPNIHVDRLQYAIRTTGSYFTRLAIT
jgi:hypothetical protein